MNPIPLILIIASILKMPKKHIFKTVTTSFFYFDKPS